MTNKLFSVKWRCECGVMKWMCPLRGKTHTQEESLLLLADMGNESAQAKLAKLGTLYSR